MNMNTLSVPYGRGFRELEIPASNLGAVLHNRLYTFHSRQCPEDIVTAALNAPIGTPPLSQLARGRASIVIISSDHTRPVPSRILMPAILEEIYKGNPNAAVTILVASGCHRRATSEELLERYGEEILDRVSIEVHDCDASDLADLGTLSSGNRLYLNSTAAQADLLIAEGFIEPHFFAGFSGGRKAVLPGIAGRSSILFNHCAQNIASSQARAGILKDNPVHLDMCEAASRARLAFILNVVLDHQKKIAGAFAGDPFMAHEAGVTFLKDLCQCKAVPADIVITTNGGYPLDQNIYQCVKGISTAELTCNKEGVIIMVSCCNDGHGGQSFLDALAEEPDNQTLMDRILLRSAASTVPDQWQIQVLLRVLLKHKVILVSDAPRAVVEALHMIWAPSVEEALHMAMELRGTQATVTVIPDGVSTLIQT